MTRVATTRHRVGIHHGDDTAADDHGNCESHAIARQWLEAGTNRSSLAVACCDGACRANRDADHACLRDREVDRFRLGIARPKPRHPPTLNPVVSQDDDSGSGGFASGGERERIEDFAERRRAVKAANAVEQSADGGHLGLERRAHPLLGFRLELLPDFTRGGLAIVSASLGDLLIHGGADAGLCISDARPHGFFGFLEDGDLRRPAGFFAIDGRRLNELLNEWSECLIDRGSNAIVE